MYDCLKIGIVVLVYKGGGGGGGGVRGKDPLDINSYRGITLTSVLAKVLESLILARLQTHLTERGIPHLNHADSLQKDDLLCRGHLFDT